MQITKYTFYIGQNVNKLNYQIRNNATINIIKRCMRIHNMQAFTITQNNVGYWDNTQENTTTLTIIAFGEDDFKMRQIKRCLESLMLQDEVMLIKEKGEVIQ